MRKSQRRRLGKSRRTGEQQPHGSRVRNPEERDVRVMVDVSEVVMGVIEET